jgi:alkylation response protein AidB-like acyl-CoA dehydrogenase
VGRSATARLRLSPNPVTLQHRSWSGYTAEAETFRAEVREVLARCLPAGWRGLGALDADAVTAFTARWREVLRHEGLLAVSWPVAHGGAGRTALEQVVLAEELVRARAPEGGPHDRFGIKMLGNTLLQWGTPEQKDYYLRRILSGGHRWCQGYSEPGSGSDLASLSTRAECHGDEWVINGQKIWTSLAHEANWIFVLARTDPSAPRHHGISFLLCPLDQPGVDIRRIATLTGDREFCEVFFTDARTDVDNVVGDVNEGWAVANTLLGFERGESAATFPLRFREELDRLVELARARGAHRDPIVRDGLARAYAECEIMRLLGMRALTGLRTGRPPGPESSVSKLYWSEYHQRVTELAVRILGADALAPEGRWPTNMVRTDDPGAPGDSASWVGTFLNARAGTIYAGTSEVQRNILGEQVLGLPREPRT